MEPVVAKEDVVVLPSLVIEAERAEQTYLDASATGAGSSLGLPPREQVNVVDVVTRQSIDDRGAFSIADAVKLVPSVRIVSPAYSNGGVGIRSRGFEATDTFVNGMRLNAFGNSFDTATIERLEVLKGPAGVQFGLAEPGGSLNVVTKRPVAQPLAAARVTAGSFDFYRGELDVGGALPAGDGALRTRLNLAAEHGGGFRDFDESERVVVAPAFQWELSPSTTWNLELIAQRDEFRFSRGLTPRAFILDLPEERSFSEPNLPLSESDQISLFHTLEHRLGDGDWKLRQRFAYSRTEGTYHEINSGVNDIDAAGNIDRSYLFSDKESRNWTLQHELEGAFETGSVEHRALLGFELAETSFGYGFYEVADPARRLGPLNVFNPGYGAYVFPSRGELVESYEPERYGNRIAAIYADYQLKPWEKLKLLAGARLDWTSGFYETRDGATDYGAADSFGFSPRAGFVYTPLKPLDLFFNYSTGFSPNLFADGAGTLFDDPEESRQFEAGLRWDLVPERLRMGLAVFSITKTNVAVPDPADPTGTRSILQGEQRSDGVEWDLTGRLLPGWDLTLGYAYVDARVTESTTAAEVGRPLVDAPQNQVSLWNRYAFQATALRGWWLGYGVLYVQERRSSNANPDFLLPSYVRHDLALGYETRGGWAAQVNVENVGDDEIFYTHGNNIHRQPPLSVRATVSKRF